MEAKDVLKKYERVDSFLRRCLSRERYEAVKLIEPCVAVSREYNKQFKFVILAKDWIYIAENPPKNSKDVKEVTKITQITSVELINDVASFLGGDLKYRAHHISITYKNDGELVQQDSNNNDITAIFGKQHGNENTTLKAIDENHSERSPTESDDLEYEFLQNRRSSMQRTPLVSIYVDDDETRKNYPPSLHHSCSSLDNYRQRNETKSPMRLAASASALDFQNERDMISGINDRLTQSFAGTSENTPKKEGSLLASLRRFKDRKSTSSPSFEKKNGLKKEIIESSSQQLELYMILDNTVMLAYLRSTWDNCLLNTALAQKERELSSSMKSNNNISSVTELFDQLEVEIISSKELRRTFVLVNELLTACRKNVLVKKLFWQSPELFAFFVERLDYYANNVMSNHSDVNQADELDCMLLLLESLSTMFRETELHTPRITNLKRDKCRVLRNLLLVTVSSPESKVAQDSRPPALSEAAEVLLTGKRRPEKRPVVQKKSSHQIELESLSKELTKHQVILLHELFIIAYEAVWFATEDNQLNILWMIKILESSEFISRFLHCVVQLVMSMVTLVEESKSSLSDENTTLLYRLFSVLKTILRQSEKLRLYIQEYYTEEFRYFVNMETLINNLSEDHPLTSSALKLVQDVVQIVTDPKNRKRLAIR